MIGGANAPAAFAIDLGLPSGTLWADRNIGAVSRSGAGYYFSWGNTVGHAYDSGYSFTDAAYALTDGATVAEDLDVSHDAAAVIMRGSWRVPSNDLYSELINYCEVSVVTIEGEVCFVLTSVVNGEILVLPAAGNMNDQGRSFFGLRTFLPSNKFNTSTRCDVLVGLDTQIRLASVDRYNGLTIRACIPGNI